MAEQNKPLIFLQPLSETLQKLKEVISENAEAEGIEVFEVDDLSEMIQLLPTVGQSLTLTSSPKKCAMFLQTNKRTIKKLQSKTILLSPKSMPRKTLDKFMKVGLTECIVEPVNPKTLLYKVRLQVRSITSSGGEEEQEMSNRFSKEGGEESSDNNSRMRTEKGVTWDDEDNQSNGSKKEKKEMEEVLIDDPRKSKKKYQEESIDAYYKGKKKSAEEVELDAEGRPKKKYQEEAINGHYKGDLAKKAEELREAARKKAEAEQYEDDAEDIEKLKKRLELNIEPDFAEQAKRELEEEIEKERKKMSALNVEEDAKKKEHQGGEKEDLGGHYKGKVNKNGLTLEDEDYEDHLEKEEEADPLAKKEKAKRLELVDDQEDYVDESESDADETVHKKKKKRLDIEADGSKDYLDKEEVDEETPEEKKKKKPLLVQNAEREEKERNKEEAFAEADQKKRDAKADQIDGYLRGGAAKKDIEIEDDEDIYHDEKKEQEQLENKKKREALHIEEDSEKDPLLDDNEYDDDFNKNNKKNEKLLLEDDEDLYGKKKGQDSEDDGFGKRRSNYRDDASEGYTKGASNGKKEDLGRKANRADARADKIQTHYSSKESLKHQDQDWGNKWEKQAPREEEYGDPLHKDNELIIEKKDLGEQTIDYGQLKKEFEAISVDGVSNKKKEYGHFENVIKAKTYKKKVAGLEGTLEEMEFEEIEEESLEEEGEQVFEPETLGIEIAIEVLDFYFEKDMSTEKLCRFLAEKVDLSFHGQTVLYSFAQGDFPAPLFNGLVFNKAGEEPSRPPEEELESYERSERREIENEYKAELKSYKEELSKVESIWEEKYQGLLSEWREFKTPDWKDHTFQIEENFFIFPFYEGVTLMGLTVFLPDEKFNPERSDAMEAVFEVARGIFITEYHKNKGDGKIREAKQKEPQKESKGLFGKLFGKTGS